MLYVSVCTLKEGIQRPVSFGKSEEWKRISRDDALHGRYKRIKCYETLSDSPLKIMLLIDSDETDVLKALSDDLGDKWDMTTYPLHELHEIIEEDHAVIAG
ncbi:MAG: hypothetical protein HZA16_10680 [Nitrospirae bacterium]|nr:hypothetical protein [Nitrospirota bacterium]